MLEKKEFRHLLNPCPFCGRIPKAYDNHMVIPIDERIPNVIYGYVRCSCGAALFPRRGNGHSHLETAIKKWNNRTEKQQKDED